MITTIVLDIEGTTSPTSSVREELYGYTRTRLPGWLAENQGGAADPILAATRIQADRPDADAAEVARILIDWLNTDVKSEPLKAAQGIICAEGFRNGSLFGEFFEDVAPALRAWRASGHELYIYSSGSVRNQKDWFEFARGGDLSPLISGHFDLSTAGPKREASSYEKIAGAIGVAPEHILFLSDHPDELDAAVAAGWSAIGVSRPGEPNPPREPHRYISDFGDLDLP
ncbi:acireductone synthase [Nocardia huaxiensis]|uniref:Acireductone synthase n=1 Tax=Nocardia huaxiensis TaxID=2755382 RepID=A0A7D6VEF0_9NOCA|nr:acireductone synthase [Nocardia huaxiensis]QLY28216.1 acireductone synthase [Nocardia huaxiensis]UFS98348.1 acireductone synthase [Nocardia huaxiensis]